MTQASPNWQQWIDLASDATIAITRSRLIRRWLARFQANWGWLLAGAMGVGLLIWQWQLVVAGAIGLAVLVSTFLIQQGQWRLPQWQWQRLWQRSNRPVTVAVGSGLLTSFGVYVSLGVWLETGGSWLARSILLQGVVLVGILLLLVWQALDRRDRLNGAASHSEEQFQRWLTDLTSPEPLQRLMAVRQLSHAVAQRSLNSSADRSLPLTPTHVTDCFRLMLDRETEPALCRALMEGLHDMQPLLVSKPVPNKLASSQSRTQSV